MYNMGEKQEREEDCEAVWHPNIVSREKVASQLVWRLWGRHIREAWGRWPNRHKTQAQYHQNAIHCTYEQFTWLRMRRLRRRGVKGDLCLAHRIVQFFHYTSSRCHPDRTVSFLEWLFSWTKGGTTSGARHHLFVNFWWQGFFCYIIGMFTNLSLMQNLFWPAQIAPRDIGMPSTMCFWQIPLSLQVECE